MKKKKKKKKIVTWCLTMKQDRSILELLLHELKKHNLKKRKKLVKKLQNFLLDERTKHFWKP